MKEKSIFLVLRDQDVARKYIDDPWSYVNEVYKSTSGSKNPVYYVTTDLQVITENNWTSDLSYQTPQNQIHHEPRLIFHLKDKPKSPWIIDLGEERYIGFLSDWYGNNL